MNTPTLTKAVMFYMRYHPKTGLVALVELDALNAAAQERDPSALVIINGVKQPLIKRGYIKTNGYGRMKGRKPIPLVIVERK